MSSDNFTYSEEIIRRLLNETKLKNKAQLAKALGYSSQSGVSNWIKRGIDWNKISEAFPDLDVNYVKFGKRSFRPSDPDVKPEGEPEVQYAAQVDLPESGQLSRDQMRELLGQIESIARILKDSLK